MTQEILGEDKSDIAKGVRLYCQAATNDAKTKEKTWNELINEKSQYSDKERRSMMAGFFSWDQRETVCLPYVDKFFETIGTMEGKHQYRYLKGWIQILMPRFNFKPRHVNKMYAIKESAKTQSFKNLI